MAKRTAECAIWRRWLACGVLTLACGTAFATDHVWVVGGGPTLAESQAQIEFNVKWMLNILREPAGARHLHVYFTDGLAPGKDVRLWSPLPDTKVNLQPLARAFGAEALNGERYRNNNVAGVDGSTQAARLTSKLTQEFSALRPGDRALFIYNGHGSYDEADRANNALRLWGDTRMSVYDLYRLMALIPPSVPVRFLFAQCFSGAFERLVHPDAADVLALDEGNRCGFFSEADDREAEGCSASINTDDYRDYTTYFFAALSGRTRNQVPIGTVPDWDEDGVLSLYDAHLYTLATAYNADLPRSTSEVFLERWQPWYLRWSPTRAETDNPYSRIAAQVATALGLTGEADGILTEARRRRAHDQQELQEQQREHASLRDEIKELQSSLQRRVGARWPETLHPYTKNFLEFLTRDLDAAQDFLIADPTFRALSEKQDRYFQLDVEMLDTERRLTQLDKLVRLRRLARLRDQFERFASAADRRAYQRLLACEQQPL